MDQLDVVVIGGGMMGAGAARHLAARGQRVACLAPGEPADAAAHEGPFASHYDAARITRALASDAGWARLAQQAIAGYGALEAATGVRFHGAVGSVMSGPVQGRHAGFVAATRDVGRETGVDFDALEGPALAARFPFFGFEDGVVALHERGGAGHIDPRGYVRAALRVAAANGARVIPEAAVGLEKRGDGVRAMLAGGEVIEARQAVVATGAYANACGLSGEVIPLTLYARTVTFFELDAGERARLAGMPSLIHQPPGDDVDFYLLPPVRYPDGRVCLKIGGDPDDRVLRDGADIRDWFREGGSARVSAWQEARVRRLMPGLRAEASFGACVTAFTPDGRAVVRRVDDRVVLLAGGNGAAAKSGDALGRAAADLVMGRRLGPWEGGLRAEG